MLSERVWGNTHNPQELTYAQIHSNPIFKNLGITYKDSINNSVLVSPKDRSQISLRDIQNQDENTKTENEKIIDKVRCRGVSYDSGIALSTKYPSINYNRFGYLYNFQNDKPENVKKQTEDLPEADKTALDKFYEEPDVPTIQQIINNPCIFNIRDKLMWGKIGPEKPSFVGQTQKTPKEVREAQGPKHRKTYSLKIDSTQGMY